MVATCRSSHDLARHLSDRLASELNHCPAAESLCSQVASMCVEFEQLEAAAKSTESHLRDAR